MFTKVSILLLAASAVKAQHRVQNVRFKSGTVSCANGKPVRVPNIQPEVNDVYVSPRSGTCAEHAASRSPPWVYPSCFNNGNSIEVETCHDLGPAAFDFNLIDDFNLFRTIPFGKIYASSNPGCGPDNMPNIMYFPRNVTVRRRLEVAGPALYVENDCSNTNSLKLFCSSTTGDDGCINLTNGVCTAGTLQQQGTAPVPIYARLTCVVPAPFSSEYYYDQNSAGQTVETGRGSIIALLAVVFVTFF